MRILGLDFGSKTVGVAVSDELMLTAQGLEIVRRQSPNKLRQTLARIEQIVTEYQLTNLPPSPSTAQPKWYWRPADTPAN